METTKISVGELIAAIPTLLAERPHETVVALSISADGLPMSAFSVRCAQLLDPQCAGVTAAAIAEDLAEQHAQFAVLAAYTDGDVRAECPALDALRLEVEYAVPWVEALVVQGNQCFRPGCFEDDCCPRELPPVPQRLEGVLTRARRRADALANEARRSLAGHRWEARLTAAGEWSLALGDGVVADAGTARRLAASLDDLCVRDWVVLTLLDAEPEAVQDALAGLETGAISLALDGALRGSERPDLLATERSRAVVERVCRAARGKRRRAATHTLAAVLDWWEGRLDAAVERCDRALAQDPAYRLAELVRLAAHRGIAPGWLAHERHAAG